MVARKGKKKLPSTSGSKHTTTKEESVSDEGDEIRNADVFQLPNGDVYVGWFLINIPKNSIVRQGLGKYFVKNGGYYSGRWYNDRLSNGRIKFKNGVKFWGTLDEYHRPVGEGTHYFPNRGWLTAEYVQGVPLADIKFIDKTHREWIGYPSVLTDEIILKPKNIFLNRPSYASAFDDDDDDDELEEEEEEEDDIYPEMFTVKPPTSMPFYLKPTRRALKLDKERLIATELKLKNKNNKNQKKRKATVSKERSTIHQPFGSQSRKSIVQIEKKKKKKKINK